MPNNKHITVDQTIEVLGDLQTKADARFRNKTTPIAESDLATALATKVNGKADAATTLAGYGITDAYTKTETDAAIAAELSSTYKAAGSLAPAGILSSLLVAANDGKVYNITGSFTTTSDFVEGAGATHPAGTNIVVVDTDTTGSTPTYKFDVLSGFVDLSGYQEALTEGDGIDIDSSTNTISLDLGTGPIYSNNGGTLGINTQAPLEVDQLQDGEFLVLKFEDDVLRLSSDNELKVGLSDGIGSDNSGLTINIDSSNSNGLSVTSSGLALAEADSSTTGALSSADWDMFNSKQDTMSAGDGIDITSDEISVEIDSLDGNGLSVSSSGLALAVADNNTTGALSYEDFGTFWGKQNPLIEGDGITITGEYSDNIAVLISNNANGLSASSAGLALDTASSSATGALTSTDWSTFNGKQDALSAGTGINSTSFASGTIAVDGDITAYTGTGAVDVTNHVISVGAATQSAAGTMSAADKTKLDGIEDATSTDIAAIKATIWPSA